MPLLANLARCVDDVSQGLVASATDEGFRAATRDALLALRRANATAHPLRDRPAPRAARHTPSADAAATPGKDGSTPSAPAAETPCTAGGPGPRGCDSGPSKAPAAETPGDASGGSSRASAGGSCLSRPRRMRKPGPAVQEPPTPATVIKALTGAVRLDGPSPAAPGAGGSWDRRSRAEGAVRGESWSEVPVCQIQQPEPERRF